MADTIIDPGWSGGAWRFRIPDVVGQIAVAIVGSYAASFAAFELAMTAGAWLSGGDHSARHDGCGLYAATVIMTSVPAMIVALIPNIVWSCWQRRLSLRRALLTPCIVAIAVLALISLGFLSARNLPFFVSMHAPSVGIGCVTVALVMFGWHRMWMYFARRRARP